MIGRAGSRSGPGADKLANGVRSCVAAKAAAAWPDIHLRETGARGLAHLCIATEEAAPPLHQPLTGLPDPSRFSKGEHHERWHHAIFLTLISARWASFTRTGLRSPSA
jgi:hypothetical protein